MWGSPVDAAVPGTPPQILRRGPGLLSMTGVLYNTPEPKTGLLQCYSNQKE